MSMSDLVNHLGSIWYHFEPLEVPYSPNQVFAISYSKPALVDILENLRHQKVILKLTDL